MDWLIKSGRRENGSTFSWTFPLFNWKGDYDTLRPDLMSGRGIFYAFFVYIFLEKNAFLFVYLEYMEDVTFWSERKDWSVYTWNFHRYFVSRHFRAVKNFHIFLRIVLLDKLSFSNFSFESVAFPNFSHMYK